MWDCKKCLVIVSEREENEEVMKCLNSWLKCTLPYAWMADQIIKHSCTAWTDMIWICNVCRTTVSGLSCLVAVAWYFIPFRKPSYCASLEWHLYSDKRGSTYLDLSGVVVYSEWFTCIWRWWLGFNSAHGRFTYQLECSSLQQGEISGVVPADVVNSGEGKWVAACHHCHC